MASIDSLLLKRVSAEIELLRSEIGGARIDKGVVTAGGTTYVGIIIAGLRVNGARFAGAKDVSLLVLVPTNYPRIPPLGVYLNQPHQLAPAIGAARAGAHFIRRGAHGVPTLEAKGWYWYCHALGDFELASGHRHWRPTARPGDGHNLASVVAAARVSLHEDH